MFTNLLQKSVDFQRFLFLEYKETYNEKVAIEDNDF